MASVMKGDRVASNSCKGDVFQGLQVISIDSSFFCACEDGYDASESVGLVGSNLLV